MFDLAFNITSKIGVGCEAVYVYNSDYSTSHTKAGFDENYLKILKTKRQYVWKNITTPAK
jgi:hypothetical protein